MKLSKLELDGTQEEIAQFLAMLDETECLEGSVDDTYNFFREHFLKEKPTNDPPKKAVNENTKSATNTKIVELVANIIRQDMTVEEIKLVANKLLSYANKKSRIESGN
ncbi:MAG: hypothetical protein IJU91_08710 [Selenomonadaceae bacterium]|nr:hypothetical protein [Selenomonadaceae bacterium]